MTAWNYIVISASAILLAFIFRKEIKRANKRMLIARLLINTIAVLALAFLGFRSGDSEKRNTSSENEIILLTKGYNPDSLNLFLKKFPGVPRIYTTEKTNRSANYIPDAGFLNGQQDIPSAVHVFGYGLNKYEIGLLNDVPLVFHSSAAPAGVQSVSWLQSLKAGDELLVQGRYLNTNSSPVKILLNGFGTDLDSMSIPADSVVDFRLKTIPKHFERAVYNFTVLSGKDTVKKEKIPVDVQEPTPVNVLILASSPDFENKFLKNRLSENGYKVVIRSSVSRNKYNREYLNTPVMRTDRLSTELLEKFDVLIADDEELTSLSRQEQSVLQSQIEQKGMGLIIRTDSSRRSSGFYSSLFPALVINNQNHENVELYLRDTSEHLASLSIKQPVYISSHRGTKPLVIDRNSQVFVNSSLYGTGKILLTTITNSYAWLLSGRDKEYRRFWSLMLNQCARKIQNDEKWNISPAISFVNDPLTLKLETSGNSIPTGTMAGSDIYMQQDPELHYKWSGTFWPLQSGWQTGISLRGSSYPVFINNENDWENIVALENINHTAAYASKHKSNSTKRLDDDQMTEYNIPKFYFVLLFIFCCSILWIEQKSSR